MAYQMQSLPTTWKPSQADIDEKPWKYIGYRSFASFVASDNDFFVLRRFSALSARVLLGLQDQLSRLEENLEVLEGRAREKVAPDIHNGSFRQETQEDREDLICQAQRLLREYSQSWSFYTALNERPLLRLHSPWITHGEKYSHCLCTSFHPSLQAETDYDPRDELIIQHSQIRARPSVPKRDISNLNKWFHNNLNAILAEETEYIKHPSDLFSLVPRVKSPLRLLLEHSSRFRLLKLWQQKTINEDTDVHYFSDEKIDHFVATVIMGLGLIMLIAPLWILAFLEGLVPRLGVISAFIVLFTALLSVTTVAKPFESLAAAAA